MYNYSISSRKLLNSTTPFSPPYEGGDEGVVSL